MVRRYLLLILEFFEWKVYGCYYLEELGSYCPCRMALLSTTSLSIFFQCIVLSLDLSLILEKKYRDMKIIYAFKMLAYRQSYRLSLSFIFRLFDFSIFES